MHHKNLSLTAPDSGVDFTNPRVKRRHQPQNIRPQAWTGSLLSCLLLFCLLPYTAAAATLADPVGDTFGTAAPAADLTSLSAMAQASELVINLGFAGTISSPDGGQARALRGFIDLDVDRNATTGAQPKVDFLSEFDSAMGGELFVDLASYGAADRRADLVNASGAVLSRVPMILSASAVQVRIPRSLLGSNQVVHVAAVVGHDVGASDVAPNGGFLASTAAPSADLLLNGDRFRVEVQWRDFTGGTGTGTLAVRSDDSAVLWFFNADNWELMVKVLDACGLNDRYWVFAAATTNVEYSLVITDTANGTVKTYSNPLGTAAASVNDTDAFASCP